MRSRFLPVIALSLLALGDASRGAAQSKNEPAKQAKKAPKGSTQQASLTGCIDEQDGKYVLIDEKDRDHLIASLEAEGFPAEGFARHLGHKVTVRGTGNSSGTERPVFRVRSVETISESCGPQEH
jgi:hypothetical protein